MAPIESGSAAVEFRYASFPGIGMTFRTIILAVALTSGCSLASTGVLAHVMPWRDGESRQLGFGRCAKGPCMKRTCWAKSRPHRHVDGHVIVNLYGTPDCWRKL